MSRNKKKVEGLPRCFPEDVFFSIHEWYRFRPTVQPMHTQDLMSVDDSDYNTVVGARTDEEGACDTFPEDNNDVIGTAFTREMDD